MGSPRAVGRGSEDSATDRFAILVLAMTSPFRHDWTPFEIESIYILALPELVYRAQTVHRLHHAPDEVQGCMLLSIKTGGCPEDCAYCPQSARYSTGIEHQPLISVEETLAAAQRAR